MRSGHSFPPLRAGLVMYLTRNLTPEASGALQADQSVTIHGSGTVDKKINKKYSKPTQSFKLKISLAILTVRIG